MNYFFFRAAGFRFRAAGFFFGFFFDGAASLSLPSLSPRRRRASPPAPTFEKDVLAETPSSAAPAAGRRRRTRPVPGTLPAVTPLPAPKKRAPPPAAADKPPREKKKPCFGGASVETLEAIESRFLGATLPLQ